MKKIVILYSTSGLGHLFSAKAIQQSFESQKDKVEIKFVNILSHGNGFFQFVHFNFYVTLMKYAKKLWAFFYYLADLPVADLVVRKALNIADKKSWRGLEELLVKEKPDAIVATHFFLASVARDIKMNKDLKVKLFLMVSGYGMHNVWFSKDIDHFFVSTEEVLEEIVRRGIPREKIHVTGMPVSKDFLMKYDRNKLEKDNGLEKDRKTVLLLSGGYGVAPIVSILNSLEGCAARIQVIVVCGYNKTEYEKVFARQGNGGWKFPIKLFGFTDRMAELMAVSDLIITKTGTSTITQALSMGLPILVFGHVPGQETPTLEHLLQRGAGKLAKNLKEIPLKVDEIFSDDKKYDEMKVVIGSIRRPDAADRMVKIVMEEI